jgi:hypothetical protein
VRRREWLGRRNADKRRDTDNADAIDSDGDRSDAIDRDRYRVPDDNRGRGIPATSHDDGLRYHDNVWSQSRRGRGRGRGVSERR